MTTYEPQDMRFVSRLTRSTLALVLAGGRGTRLHELTQWRAKPSVYFGGQFRIIDFPLSNCLNSDIRQIGVLTQYKAHSLIRHLVHGWTSRVHNQGEFIEILPASQRTDGEWYRGTADAIYQNLDIIRALSPDFVLVLAGDHIYKMDYGPMIAAHVQSQADMTVACAEVPVQEAAGAFGVMTADESSRVVDFHEKPASPAEISGRPGWCLASMGNYVFNTKFLYEQVIRDADDPKSHHDFGRNVIPNVIKRYRVLAYPFRDESGAKQAYWRDVGTLDAFWEANMDLASVTPELNLYDKVWPILTYRVQAPPAKFVFNNRKRRGIAVDSLISEGCVLSGARVENSLLFSNVRVHSYSRVSESVVLPEVDIGRSCRIERAIIDRGAVLPDHTVIGRDHAADRARGFRVTENGITLVTPDMLGQKLHFTR